VRRVITALLVIAAVGCDGTLPSAQKSVKGAAWAGPDAVLVRLPRAGGAARAYRWATDSVLWTSSQPVPAAERLLAFDDEQGTLAFVDAKGIPGRLELRLGFATPAAPAGLRSLVSADGWAVFGITAKREVQRLTPSGNWSYGSALTPRMLLPQPDGSLVLLNDIGTRSVLRRLHPPEARITDTAWVPKVTFAVPTPLGDRIYFATDSGLAGVRVRDLARTRTVALPGPAVAAAATPSGDRIFVALAGEPTIAVIDRYEEKVVRTINIGAPAAALRMDPDGRYVLAERDGQDSAAVISVADSRVVRVIATKWRADVPLVAPDGAILALDSTDAVDVDPVTGKVRRRYVDGAADLWALIRWNGFRPRAKGLDVPVNFDADSTDSTRTAAPDSAVAPAPGATPATPPAPAPARDEPPADAAKRGAVWTLSFAAMLDEQRAKLLSASIHVDGKPVRVAKGTRDGVSIWRIVYGPFPTREEAERAGRRTGLPYWVYEDAP